jgi:long-subunit fatty acid transport protein
VRPAFVPRECRRACRATAPCSGPPRGRVGVSYRPIDAVTLAAAYETRSRYQDFSFDVLSHTIQTPGGPVTVAGGEEKLALDQPQAATIGIAVRPVAALLVAADVQWVRWSEVVGAGQPELTSDPQGILAYETSMSQLGFELGWRF